MDRLIFAEVQGYPKYEVSECGEVYRKEYIRVGRLKQGVVNIKISRKKMKIIVDNGGYRRVHLTNGKKHTLVLLHRAIAIAFIPNPLKLPQVNHIDGDKSNNNISNLEWVSLVDNMRHSWRIGLRKAKMGESNPKSKLTRKEVIKIFKSSKSKTELSKIYNVSYTSIHYIKIGRTWASVTNKLYA